MRTEPGRGSPASAGDGCLHEGVVRNARRAPGSLAVAGAQRLTYAELDDASGTWAALLAAAGVGPTWIVPIVLPRSASLVLAALAVLKTGGAYALLDPGWPEARIREAVARLGAKLVVCHDDVSLAGDVARWVPPSRPVPVPGWRPVPVDPSAPSTAFLTSGTTGTPKFVVSPHRATTRLFGPQSFARFSPGTVVAVASPVSWDAFSLELWSALVSGGTAAIVPEPFLSAEALRTTVAEHGTDTAWLTSSLFNVIVDEDPGAFQGLCQLMVGGERLSPPHVARFLRAHPRIVLINGYGPVENTIFMTTHRVEPGDCDRPGGIPLGVAVGGTQVHVLDGDRPCAPGETGEICASGTGLALGYLDDPERTARSFTAVAIDGAAERVYRTGDLGVLDSAGLLHFKGRADRQVKVRGHRVELAEIERQVERVLPSVRSCRVLARRTAAGDTTELVAFCVPIRAGDTLADAVPTLHAAMLPHHRPAAVVGVGGFPLTERGKLDERALWESLPAAASSAPDADALSPGGTAQVVAGVFAAVLGVSAVPRDVPFTRLGGTSLDAGRVCARLSTQLGRQVPVSVLYRYETAAALAAWAAETAPPEESGHDDRGDVPLTPQQLLFLSRELAGPQDRTSHCLLVWAVEGPLDHTALRSAIAALHARHEPLRSAYLADPRPCAIPIDVPPPDLVVLPAHRTETEALVALRGELGRELDIAGAAVWRAAVVPSADDHTSALLGCAVHHIAFDGWSESVFARDLAALYNRARELPWTLPAKPPSPAAIRAGDVSYASQADLPAQRARLAQELAGTPEIRWPGAPAGGQAGEPGLVTATIPAETVVAVDAAAVRAGTSRFAVLLAQHAGALAELTGQQDFGIGVPVACRDRPGLEDAVGCHITMVCVRLRDDAVNGGGRAIEETGRALRRALAAQDVPLNTMLAWGTNRTRGRAPLFQTLFALQDNDVPRLELTGVRTRFRRQRYLDLPLELHAELWPDADGGLGLTVYFRPEAVAEQDARNLALGFTRRLESIGSEVQS
ncbi:non-ribosomal peptide synthase [Saccharomonospora marina XMU15]|uniref:Non-ribosomal peptide synthase n=1 Tax=Saccharomonospora marina XMU15 TaxID=882083 RepID=H5X7T0_9PSEU|nr:AMP-binding protein [Saccharomonospora marina]EHR52430.1 non-ribosomal peptide synthase [Saccharomonospora marina XMU15]